MLLLVVCVFSPASILLLAEWERINSPLCSSNVVGGYAYDTSVVSAKLDVSSQAAGMFWRWEFVYVSIRLFHFL